MWGFFPSRSLTDLANGTRVSRHGTVSFTRSGFARVRWDDGTVSDWWVADLIVEREARAA